MSRIVQMFAFALVALLAGCSSEPPTVVVQRETPQCIINSQCAAGQVCIGGTCTVECAEARDCTEGKVCQSGLCQSPGVSCSPACTSPQECAAGRCVECTSDAKCASDQTCVNNRCIARTAAPKVCDYNSECPQDQLCINRVCRVECVNDRDCPTTDGCVNSKCTARAVTPTPACTVNAQCTNAGESCVGGRCVLACSGDSDCRGGRVCSSGQCVVTPCQVQTDCNSAAGASTGRYCSVLQTCVYDCRLDTDCSGADQVCNSVGRCQSRSGSTVGSLTPQANPRGLLASDTETITFFGGGQNTARFRLENRGTGPVVWHEKTTGAVTARPSWLAFGTTNGTIPGQSVGDGGVQYNGADVTAFVNFNDPSLANAANARYTAEFDSDGGSKRITFIVAKKLEGVFTGRVFAFVNDRKSILETALSAFADSDSTNDMEQFRNIEGGATLGSLDLQMALRAGAGTSVTGTTEPDESPAFPTRAGVTGTLVGNEITLNFTITTSPIGTNNCDRVGAGAPAGCVRDNPNPLAVAGLGPITRQITIRGYADQTVIRGSYREDITGLRPGQTRAVTGYVLLSRSRDLRVATDATGNVTGYLEPAAPDAASSGSVPATADRCAGVVNPAGTTFNSGAWAAALLTRASTALAGSRPSDAVFACRDRSVDGGASCSGVDAGIPQGSVQVPGAGVDGGLLQIEAQQPYVVRDCASGESPTSAYCYNVAAIESALRDLQCLASQQPDYQGLGSAYLDTVSTLLQVYTMRGNDLIASALGRQWRRGDALPIDEEMQNLQSAFDGPFKSATMMFFGNQDVISKPSWPAGAQLKAYELATRLAARDALARSEYAKRVVRKNESQQSVGAASTIRSDLLKAYYQAFITGSILQDRGQDLKAEFDQYRIAIRDSQKSLQTIRRGLNPIGYQETYVPFYFQPENSGSLGSNNFKQLLNYTKQTLLPPAKSRELDALSARRSYEMSLNGYKQQLNDSLDKYDSQLAQLCGVSVREITAEATSAGETVTEAVLLQRLLDRCGLYGGDIYSQRKTIEQADLRIEQASARQSALNERVNIEMDRVRSVTATQAEIAEVYTSFGEKRAANTIAVEKARQAEAAEERRRAAKKSLWGSIAKIGLAVGGAVLAPMTGGATLAITAKIALGNAITAEKGNIASAIGGLMTSGSEDNSAVDRTVALRAERDKLDAMEKAQVQYKTMDIERTNSAAQIKSWLTEMHQIQIDGMIAESAADQETARLRTMIESVYRIASDRSRALNMLAANAFADPTQRLERDATAVVAEQTFEELLRYTYLTAKAFEYETNVSYAPLARLFAIRSVYQARDFNGGIERFLTDMDVAYNDYRASVGNPQPRQDIISLRRDIFGLADPYYIGSCSVAGGACESGRGTCLADPRSGDLRCKSNADARTLFRQKLLDGGFTDSKGRLSIPFATNVNPGNPIFSTNIFNDRIKSIRVDLIGSNLGDDQGVVYIEQGGTSFVRTPAGFAGSANESVRQWNVRPWRAAIAASFNGQFSLPPEVVNNTELFGRSVAFANWAVVIDRTNEPRNTDIDFSTLEDIRIIVLHEGYTVQDVQGRL